MSSATCRLVRVGRHSRRAPRRQTIRHDFLSSRVVQSQTASCRSPPPPLPPPLLTPFQSRSMVMVTKTKVDELPPPPSSITAAGEGNNNNAQPQEQQQHQQNQQQLHVTDACYKRIQQLVAKKQGATLETVYLRVFVDAGGCSGFSYQFEVGSEELEDDDLVFTDPESGARVVVDEGSLELIRGSTIDYVQEMIKSGFEVRENPQSESACGCGSSFALKNFAANPAID